MSLTIQYYKEKSFCLESYKRTMFNLPYGTFLIYSHTEISYWCIELMKPLWFGRIRSI